jgi:hypothetical protein
MFPDTVQYSVLLVLMNHLYFYCDLWQRVLPCKVIMSQTPSLLLMRAHDLQVETAGRRTDAVNHGIGWLHYEKWWSYLPERQTVLFEMCITVYRTVILNCDHRYLPAFRSRSSAKSSQIPRPTRNRTQSSSPNKDASKPVIAASVRRSRSGSNLQHAWTPMTPKCWSGSIHQTAHSSR